MKRLLILLVSLQAISAFAQNYQTIKSDQINYFGTPNLKYILATRTDSVLMDGADSLFYSFSTLRHEWDSTNQCQAKRGAPWYGQKVIIKTNGDNCFFNKDLDTITFKTTAALNDTFLVYTYPNGNWVKGWVSGISLEVHLTVADSIKEITLFSNDSTFIYAHDKIKIGKHLGFVSVSPFYSFPEKYGIDYSVGQHIEEMMQLIGSEYPRIGVTRRKVGEIYNYEVGDRLGWWETVEDTWSYIVHDYGRTIDVTSKSQWGSDSVLYNLDYGHKNKTVDYNYNPAQTSQSAGTSAIVRKYYDLDSMLNNTLPEELYWIENCCSNLGSVYQSWMKVDYCGKIIEGTIEHGLGIVLDSLGEPDPVNCIDQIYIEPEYWTLMYGEGIGGPYVLRGYSFLSYYSSHRGNVSFWENSTSSCGNGWYVGLNENETAAFKIYPNPTSGILNIDLDNSNKANCLIYDLSGKIVHSTLVADPIAAIDLSHLNSGTYLIQLDTQTGSSRQKIVIY